MVTQKELKRLFSYNKKTGILKRKVRTSNCNHVGDIVGCSNNSSGRLQVKLNYKTYFVHRLIFMMCHGYLPEMIDHDDGNYLNNKINNLRPATPLQNCYNSKIRKDNASGVKGVSWNTARKKWMSRIRVNSKEIYLGLFTNKQEAINAVKNKRIELHGEFANHG